MGVRVQGCWLLSHITDAVLLNKQECGEEDLLDTTMVRMIVEGVKLSQTTQKVGCCCCLLLLLRVREAFCSRRRPHSSGPIEL